MITVLKGVVIGVANIIPGVSGGTLAVILGIYDKLIGAISHYLSDSKNRAHNTLFLGQIGLGAVIGVLLFSKLILFLLLRFHQPTFLFFIGLILGSIPIIYRQDASLAFSFKNSLFFGLGFLGIVSLAFLPEQSHLIISQLSLGNSLFLGMAGLIAAATMVIPGVSGSAILLLIGAYTPIVTAVSERNLPVIGIVGVGAVIGILVVTHLIDFLLKQFHSQTMSTILGLLAGSGIVLWPGIPFTLLGVSQLIFIGMGAFIATKLS